ncbi:YlzJ-like family protein [Gracilibacillus alcaliphilus]|uniref:YlzJ-like family protein n=1 Tax=Gracilibacillus alcaliphilus TaxID=1401441 RepID=UPI001EF7D92A|nr:YlzJ-like family protein [Gracilibacillus alcaliphilus]MBM7677999.1 hypothetical protein [Gracilibacillus alcaliphilus]
MLYTPLGYDDIYGADQWLGDYEFIRFQGKQCCVQKLSNGEVRMIQLLSTNPNDYLLDTFTPGNIINNQ